MHNTWTLTTRCTATGEIRSEITRIRAVISNTNGTRLTSGWEIVADGYPDPTLTMNVSEWENTGESAGTNAGYVDYNMSADAGGLARAAGPCETQICSLVFQGGMPDINGVIRPTSRFGSDGDNIMMPGTWNGRITNGGDHVGVIDQPYVRAAILVNGETMLTTDWQARSSLPVDIGNGGVDAAFVGAGIPLAASLIHNPCVELAPTQPHTNPSSVSDPAYECLAAEQAGQTWVRAFAAMAKKWGTPAVAAAAATVAGGLGVPRHGTPQADPQERPDFLRSVGNLIRRQRVKTPAFNSSTDDWSLARNVIKQCLKMYGSTSGCDRYAIWSPGEDVDEVAAHDLMAITTGHSPLLTYASSAEKGDGPNGLPRKWYKLAANTPNNCTETLYEGDVLNCDEYPYYASEESDIHADLKLLDAFKNQSEGSKMNAFATTCRMPEAPRGDVKRKFIVVPIPVGAPTTGWCTP